MNDRLPYEDQLSQQLSDLPLPDENRAWEDMKRRLDKDDDDRIIPIWLRGCGLWGLLAIIAIGIAWWIIRPDKWRMDGQESRNVTSIEHQSKKDSVDGGTPRKQPTDSTVDQTDKISETIILTDNDSSADGTTSVIRRQPGKIVAGEKTQLSEQVDRSNSRSQRDGTPFIVNNKSEGQQTELTKKKDQAGIDRRADQVQPVSENKARDIDTARKTYPVTNVTSPGSITTSSTKAIDSLPVKTQQETRNNLNNDSASNTPLDSIAKAIAAKKENKTPKAFSVSAGPGMHQLIPIDGQKFNPYNSAGRKGSVADYIPSVFVRLYRNNKWFIQMELRYGAPQYSSDLLYRQTFKFDSVGTTGYTTTTSSRLKKTFYHQIPLTFNYLITPNWSVGAGITWNKFVSAVSQKDVTRKNNMTSAIDSSSSSIITDKGDSTFKKSYFQAVFESQYKWKRFSIGAKYSFGLQPFIRFTLAGGGSFRERNKSLQVFIRYELWRSK